MPIAPPIRDPNEAEGMLPFGGASEPPEVQPDAAPDVSVPAQLPTSPLGAEIAPGQQIPPQEVHHARMKGLEESAAAHRQAAAANADALGSLDVTDPDYYKKVLKLTGQHNALHTAHGEIQQAKAEEEQANPWGTIGNHPGIGGKLGHAFGVLGNVAGNAILGKGNMSGIPGSQAALEKEKAGGAAEQAEAAKETEEGARGEEAQAAASEAPSKIKLSEAQAEKDLKPTDKTTKPEPVFDKAGNIIGFNTGTDLVGMHNPALTPDMREMASAAHVKPQKDENTKARLQTEIAAAQEAGDTAQVKKLQQELKAIDPEGSERIGISLEGLKDRETTAADKKSKPFQDVLDEADEARQFAAQPSPTNDFGLLMSFIGITKPESIGKLRLQQSEIKLVLGTRSSLGDLEALGNRIANGQMLTPEQRKDMLGTIQIMEDHAKRRLGGAGAVAPTAPTGGGAELKPPKAADPGMKWQHKTDAAGKVQWRQVAQ